MHACMHTNEMETLFARVYRGDRKAEGLVNRNWNVVNISVCAAVAVYADPCLRA